MTTDIQAAKDDFAFMRALVEGGESGQARFGWTYGLAGLFYGVQVLAQAAEAAQWWRPSPLVALAVITVPTVLLIATIAIASLPGARQRTNMTSRAVNLSFACIGTANLALMLAIGSVALRMHNMAIWMVYGCVVLILQGAAWLIAALLRRRLWQGAVAFGWFATGISMAQVTQNISLYCLIAAFGLMAFMALPGAILFATAKKAS